MLFSAITSPEPVIKPLGKPEATTCPSVAVTVVPAVTVVLAETEPDAPPAETEPLLVVIVPVPPTEIPVPVVVTTPTSKVFVPFV